MKKLKEKAVNDARVNSESAEPLLVPAEDLNNPAKRHRYYDEQGNLLPVRKLNLYERVWAAVNRGNNQLVEELLTELAEM